MKIVTPRCDPWQGLTSKIDERADLAALSVLGGLTARQSEATAEMLKRWRTRVDVAAKLAPDKAALRNAAGWSAARVTAAQALVEAFAKADTDQQAAIQTYSARIPPCSFPALAFQGYVASAHPVSRMHWTPAT